jgi:hypothetical protein
MATRRSALVTLVAGSAAAALAQSQPELHQHQSDSAPIVKTDPEPERTTVLFRGRDYETLVRLTDLIIPRTDTPGAADVGVAWHIDKAISKKKELYPLYQDGFVYLNRAASKQGQPDFLSLPQDVQVALLTEICEAKSGRESEFFQSLKELTIEWYYNSETGLARELGYKGNTYRAEFVGCTHPEHWPAQQG